jgi:hypothetical protein
MESSKSKGPVFMKLARLGMVVAAIALSAIGAIRAAKPVGAAAAQGDSPSTGGKPLDFEIFKTRVEPIFLKKRSGHVRCYVCHARSKTAFRLEKLSRGSTFWTEEQSRRNFRIASQLVVPGDPTSSRLLMHPLAPEAGGDDFHSGGRQFASENDPDWLILAEWVRGQKTRGSPSGRR